MARLLLILCLTLLYALAPVTSTSAATATTGATGPTESTEQAEPPATPGQENGFEVASALLMELNSDEMLFSQSPDVATPPASLTKVMTLYVLFDAVEKGEISLLDRVRVSAKADRVGGSSMGALTNHEYSLWEVIKGVAVASGNDAAQAVAENFPGGYETFVARMNATCQELGLNATHFENPHGLHHEAQTTTAQDMLILAAHYLRRFPQTLRLHSMPFSWQGEVKLRNRNRLLGTYSGVDGLKTGYVRASGYNVIVTARRNGVRLVGVILGASSPGKRGKVARKLLEQGFAKAGNDKLLPPSTSVQGKDAS